MALQGYYLTIFEKTGKTPDEFLALARERGLVVDGSGEVPATPIVTWLMSDFALGRGHAMSLVHYFRQTTLPAVSTGDKISTFFVGGKARWQLTWDELMETVMAFGPHVSVAPASTYLSLMHGRGKFAIVATTADRMDVGLKLKGVAPTERLQPAGSWNSMVTHRVKLFDGAELDEQLKGWLRDAYDRAAPPGH